MTPRLRALSAALVLFAVVALGAAVVEALDFLDRPAPAGPAPSAADVVEIAVPPEAAPPPGRVRVQVLNGAGQPGLARRATSHLRAAGFDVVHFGNAREFGRDTTIVIDRVGDAPLAEAVATAMGVPVVLRSDPDPSLELEVTVVVGRNWPPVRTRPDSARSHPVVRLWRRLLRD